MKYFITSDIHGHYDELIEALKQAGFEELNDNHLLVVAGDMFDRGDQSKEVLDYLYRLAMNEKAIVLKGNHEVFLEDLFDYNYESVNWNSKHNGFSKTLQSFVPNAMDLDIEEIVENIRKLYPYLETWIRNLPYYLELNEYIITHAGLDFSNGDWRNGNWKKAIWYRSEEFFEVDLIKEYQLNKKVVVGHRMTAFIRKYFTGIEELDFSIYYHPDEQKIGIDGGSYYSKRINVLLINEK